MAEVVIHGMRDYCRVVELVRDHGEPVDPRQQGTVELRGVTVINRDPTDCLPPPWRRPNLAITAAEALQLLGGVSHPELLKRIAAPFGNFTDGGIFHGAYGPRLRTQLPRVLNRLRTDAATRQAVLVIWDPLHDLVGDVEDAPRDVPCTLTLQFFIRPGRVEREVPHLETHVHMRSNDLWLGFPYDVGQFAVLASALASALGVPLGDYVHHVGSLHLYDRDHERVKNTLVREALDAPFYEPTRLGAPGRPEGSLWESTLAARQLLEGSLEPRTLDERWFHAQLRRYLT